MTTATRDFVVKGGLTVEGTQGTIDGDLIVTESALNGSLGNYIELLEKGVADGVATLDSTGNVPSDQLGNVPAGPQGTTGSQGIQGVQGPQGIDGLQGLTGIQGENGLQGIQGIQGLSQVAFQTTAPESTNILWFDTDDTGEPVIPQGGLTGQVLTKASNTDYDTQWSTVDTQSSDLMNVMGAW